MTEDNKAELSPSERARASARAVLKSELESLKSELAKLMKLPRDHFEHPHLLSSEELSGFHAHTFLLGGFSGINKALKKFEQLVKIDELRDIEDFFVLCRTYRILIQHHMFFRVLRRWSETTGKYDPNFWIQAASMDFSDEMRRFLYEKIVATARTLDREGVPGGNVDWAQLADEYENHIIDLGVKNYRPADLEERFFNYCLKQGVTDKASSAGPIGCMVVLVLLLFLGGAAMLPTSRPTAAPIRPVPAPVLSVAVSPSTPSTAQDPPPAQNLAVNVRLKPVPRPDPIAMLSRYYQLLNSDQFEQAYSLRSRDSRAKTSQRAFLQVWDNNRSIQLLDAVVISDNTNRKQVKVRLLADDLDRRTGQSKPTYYRGTVNLRFEDEAWRYDGGDFRPEPGTLASASTAENPSRLASSLVAPQQHRPSYSARPPSTRPAKKYQPVRPIQPSPSGVPVAPRPLFTPTVYSQPATPADSPPPPFPLDRIASGGRLFPGDILQSPNGRYRFCCQHDGNCVVYYVEAESQRPLWQTETSDSTCSVILTSEGRVIVLGSSGDELWHSESESVEEGLGTYHLQMQDDGNLVVYRHQGSSYQPIWATRTHQNGS